MLQKFSWSEYWTVVIAVVAVYYAIVFLLLYKYGLLKTPALKKLVLTRPQQQTPSAAPTSAQAGRTIAKLRNQAETENQLKNLTDELLQFLEDIAGKSFIKEEIIMGLQLIVREYKEFSETNYRSDIDEFIRVETENHCSVDLSDEEIQRVWMG
ncbi:hypothetical protein [Longitalea luteola]|uniref:hypothetical protein n=1 Tax=Longitalea luteola TaxID=2812563 RepID=UPI001A961AAF|nr:hypothetical protein [Longitalea luteola]